MPQERLILEQEPGLKKTLEIEDGKARVKIEEQCEDVLELNQKQQNNFSRFDLHGEKNWAIPLARIPYVIYQQLIAENPELSSRDNEIRTKAWMRVIKERQDIRTVPKNFVPSGNRFDLK